MVCCLDCILPKGPYPPCLRMANWALLAGYHRHENTFYYQIWHYLSRPIKDEAESAAWVLWLHNSDCLISDSAPSENWKLMHDIGKLIVLLRHRAIDIYGGTLDNGNLWWAVGQVIIMAQFWRIIDLVRHSSSRRQRMEKRRCNSKYHYSIMGDLFR